MIRKGASAKLNGPLCLNSTSRGYLAAALFKENKGHRKLVHRLVATAFLGCPEQGWEVNHKNGNKTNNAVENLEWVTSSRNKLHAFDTGLYKIGEQHYNARFREEDIRSIRKRIRDGERACDIAREYGVHRGTIGNIKRKTVWSRLPD